jgi:hypothetical protein
LSLTKDELLTCVIDAFAKSFTIADIDTKTDGDQAIRLLVGGHRLKIHVDGTVYTLKDSMTTMDIVSKMAKLVLAPIISRRIDLKLAA